MKKEKVLVVGGGFGGVKAALELAGDERFEVTLLSDDMDFRNYPTLYHTATGGSRASSSIPLKLLFEAKPINLVKGAAKTLDRKTKTVTSEDGQSYSYDTLVIGLGVVTNYFGIEGLPEYSYSIKSQSEVERFKKHLHQQMTDERRPDLHYVIVGAGPTGIELAGALPDYLHEIMEKHGVKDRKVHIDLIEALPRLLPRLPKKASRQVKRRLKKLGIRIYLGKAVQGQTADELMVSGKPVRSHTVVWTAGVTNHPFFTENQFALTKRGKVSVDVYLQAEDNIFVIGDNANTPYSGLAQTALHDGKFVAKNLKRRIRSKKLRSYTVKQPITVIPAGPRWSLVLWGHATFGGWRGWLLREAADLIGYHDLAPWPKAAKQYATGFEHQDNCPICATAVQ